MAGGVPMLDFSPLGDLVNTYREGRNQAIRQRTLADLGQGEGNIDPRQLIASGDMNLAQMGFQLQQRQAEADRQARQEAYQRERAAVEDKFRTQQLGQTAAYQNRSLKLQEENQDYSPQERASMASQYGIQPGTPEFKTFVLTGALPQAKTDSSITQQIDQRRQAAESTGLKPDNPGYQSFVLTGKMPREDAQPLTATDKNAILTADEAVQTNKAVITALDEAMKISPQAHTGIGASARAAVGNVLPDRMVPDALASKESAAATSNYENIVLGQALSQLKSIFGAAPTEGERKILLELQASVNKPDNVRQDILKRAKGMAESRLEFNQNRANQLRGNTYYKPQGQPSASGPAAPAPAQAAPQPAGPAGGVVDWRTYFGGNQ